MLTIDNMRVIYKQQQANRIFAILFVFCVGLCFCSCSTDDSEKTQRRIEVTKIVENRQTKDLLNDLYIGCDGDVESLSRILGTTPSIVDRIRNGKTEATAKFAERIQEVSVYYSLNDQKFSKLQSVLDPEYGWYDSVLNFPSHHPYIFWGSLIALIVVSFLFAFLGGIVWGSWILLAGVHFFLVAWICSLIFSPGKMDDPYTNNINPVMEQLI